MVASPNTVLRALQHSIGDFPIFTRNFRLTLCSALAVSAGFTKNKKTPNKIGNITAGVLTSDKKQEETKVRVHPSGDRKPDRQ